MREISSSIISRLAPTPSGYLHLGNILNFVLTWWITKKLKGKLALRIDDADSSRFKNEYVEDIFQIIDWLGLSYEMGPNGPTDFHKNYSQQNKQQHYYDFLKNIPHQYCCECTRKEIHRLNKKGVYPGICQNKNLTFVPKQRCIRVHLLTGVVDSTLPNEIGDFVLWRKENLPAYQLASLVDDIDLNTNLIIRGEDLIFSSKAQLYLAKITNQASFLNTRFFHHKLLKTSSGKKLSKSNQPGTVQSLKSSGLKKIELLAILMKEINFLYPNNRLPINLSKLEDLLEFDPPSEIMNQQELL